MSVRTQNLKFGRVIKLKTRILLGLVAGSGRLSLPGAEAQPRTGSAEAAGLYHLLGAFALAFDVRLRLHLRSALPIWFHICRNRLCVSGVPLNPFVEQRLSRGSHIYTSFPSDSATTAPVASVHLLDGWSAVSYRHCHFSGAAALYSSPSLCVRLFN